MDRFVGLTQVQAKIFPPVLFLLGRRESSF